MQTLLIDDFAEIERIKAGTSSLRPVEQTYLMSRYFRSQPGCGVKKTEEALREFIHNSFPDGASEQWGQVISNAVKNAKKFPLKRCDGIPVTDKELRIVKRLEHRNDQKMLFTLIVLAKYFNWRRDNDSNWVNIPLSNILKLAGGNITTDAGYMSLHRLYTKDLIAFRRGIGDLAVRVCCLHEKSPVILCLTDMRAIGFEYLNYAGMGDFIRCAECGILVRQSRNGGRRYCDRCRAPQSGRPRKVECRDCGEVFWVDGYSCRTVRCNPCQAEWRREQYRLSKTRSRRMSTEG